MLTVISLRLPYSVEVEEKEEQEEEEEEEGVLVLEEQETSVKKKKKKDKKKHVKEEPLSEEEPCTSTAVPVCLFLITNTIKDYFSKLDSLQNGFALSKEENISYYRWLS